MKDIDTARLELTTFFEKVAHDLIPLLVNSILKPPDPPEPPPPTLENVVIAYPLPEIGMVSTFSPPPGDGWNLTSLDTNAGDRVLGHWYRRVFVDAEFSDTESSPPPDYGHDFSDSSKDGCLKCGMSAEYVNENQNLCPRTVPPSGTPSTESPPPVIASPPTTPPTPQPVPGAPGYMTGGTKVS